MQIRHRRRDRAAAKFRHPSNLNARRGVTGWAHAVRASGIPCDCAADKALLIIRPKEDE